MYFSILLVRFALNAKKAKFLRFSEAIFRKLSGNVSMSNDDDKKES